MRCCGAFRPALALLAVGQHHGPCVQPSLQRDKRMQQSWSCKERPFRHMVMTMCASVCASLQSGCVGLWLWLLTLTLTLPFSQGCISSHTIICHSRCELSSTTSSRRCLTTWSWALASWWPQNGWISDGGGTVGNHYETACCQHLCMHCTLVDVREWCACR
jgi:hypothetical protein